jgi:hypothetical protein
MSPLDIVLLVRRHLVDAQPPSTIAAVLAIAEELGVPVDDHGRPTDDATPFVEDPAKE